MGLGGETHHTGREKAYRGDCLSKAGLAVDMGQDALSGLIFVDDDLVGFGFEKNLGKLPHRD